MNKEVNPFTLDVVSVRLVKDAEILSEKPFRSVEDVVALLGEKMCELDREVICVVNMKNNGIPINCHFASMGSINYAIAHPRELFKASILSNASQLLLIHNHVSGSLQPSIDDVRITDRMVNLCEHMGIPLVDHIIVGGDHKEYFSFLEQNVLPVARLQYEEHYENIHFPVPIAAKGGRSR